MAIRDRSYLWCAVFLLLVASGCGSSRGVEDARRKAEEGDPAAQYRYGVTCAQREEDAEAVKWFRRAAEAGNVDAQGSLAFMYASGRGVARDDVEAATWYRRAADRGSAEAQYNLGIAYATGRGVAQDDLAAHVWVSLALSRTLNGKREKWSKALDAISRRLTEAQLDEARRRAQEWKPVEGG